MYMSKSIAAAVAFLFAVAVPLPASATPQEEAYIAARDKYLKHFETGDPAKDPVQKDMDRAIADLKDKLEAIIGPVAVKGVDPKPRNNLVRCHPVMTPSAISTGSPMAHWATSGWSW
jgi:hypothetical protein